jgi:hypothetical protein
MIQNIWFNYLFFFVIVFMVLYAIWWAMGHETNKKTEPNKVLDFLDRHLLLVGCLLTFSALIVFVVSLFIGEIYITINTFDTGGFLYFYYDLNSPIFNILFDVPLVAGLYCFYGHFNRKGRLNKKILKVLGNHKLLVIIPIIVFVFGVWILINGASTYYGRWVPTFNPETNSTNTFDLSYFDGNITITQDGNIRDRNGNLILTSDNYLDNYDVRGNRIYLGNGYFYNFAATTIENGDNVIAYYEYNWRGFPSLFAGICLVFIVTPFLLYIVARYKTRSLD